ncbi:MAG: tetratricopeptide repeat protein [Candidatus Thorarchaeota archaeon]|nr:MAG: tetratricopeptide repeat protein [Candidatus Thorarchaeota archaeon]
MDREDYIEWMKEALERCSHEKALLYIYGIGGIGKSALFRYWESSVTTDIFVDCGTHVDFFERIDAVAKGAQRLGIKLRRYDTLWHLRQRFVKGVEPAKASSRGWALEILSAVPFIGSLGDIGKAIQEVGKDLGPRIKGRLGDVGQWLRDRLGKTYGEKLLEILWKQPSHAEFLFVDALLEDLNNRDPLHYPLLIIFDQFEDVDQDNLRWRYKGRRVAERELWCTFLSLVEGTVGVIGSREVLSSRLAKELGFLVKELEPLDEESCRELLDLRGVDEVEMQSRIIKVGLGNPFVHHAICDLADIGGVSLDELESLRARTLEEVRLKAWRRLFNRAGDLLDIIDRAGMVPFFDKDILTIIAPWTKTHHWEKLKELSFVRPRQDGKWELHNLAREIVIAELDDRLPQMVDKVSERLEEASKERSDLTLLGLVISARALASEENAISQFREMVSNLLRRKNYTDAMLLFGATRFSSDKGIAVRMWLKGKTLNELNRIADGEQALRESVQIFRTLAETAPSAYSDDIATVLCDLAYLLRRTNRTTEAEVAYREALQIRMDLAEKEPDRSSKDLATTLQHFAWFLRMTRRLEEAEEKFRQALDIYRNLLEDSPEDYLGETAETLNELGILLRQTSRPEEAEEAMQEALTLVREAVKISPEPDIITLATIMYNRASLLRQTGRVEEAEDILMEALEALQDISSKTPDVFMPHVVTGLRNLAVLQRQTGRPAEAEKSINDALNFLEELSETAPTVCQPYIAWCHRNLGTLLSQVGRTTEAEECFQESLRLYQDLAEKGPQIFKRSVAYTLHSLAILLRKTGRLSEALSSINDALELYQEYVTEAPAAYERYLAVFLNNLALIQSRMGAVSEAEVTQRKTVEIKRRLTELAPELYVPDLAVSLNNLGVLLRRKGELNASKEFHNEAIEIWRLIFDDAPMLFTSRMACSLNNLAVVLGALSNNSESLEMFSEALKLRRELADRAPDMFSILVVSTLNNLGVLYGRIEEYEQAERCLREALEMGQHLAESSPEVYQPSVNVTLSNLIQLSSIEKALETSDERVVNRLRKMLGKQEDALDIWLEDEEDEDLGF